MPFFLRHCFKTTVFFFHVSFFALVLFSFFFFLSSFLFVFSFQIFCILFSVTLFFSCSLCLCDFQVVPVLPVFSFSPCAFLFLSPCSVVPFLLRYLFALFFVSFLRSLPVYFQYELSSIFLPVIYSISLFPFFCFSLHFLFSFYLFVSSHLCALVFFTLFHPAFFPVLSSCSIQFVAQF